MQILYPKLIIDEQEQKITADKLKDILNKFQTDKFDANSYKITKIKFRIVNKSIKYRKCRFKITNK